MLVTKLLQEVDAQLERLQTARDTIAALIAEASAAPAPNKRKARSSPKPETAAAAGPALLPPNSPAVEVTLEPEVSPVQPAVVTPVAARRRGRPKGSVNLRPGLPRTPSRITREPEPTALTHTVATGPVFVSAAELERRRKQPVVFAAPKPEEAIASEGTLESLIREVAERRTATAA